MKKDWYEFWEIRKLKDFLSNEDLELFTILNFILGFKNIDYRNFIVGAFV